MWAFSGTFLNMYIHLRLRVLCGEVLLILAERLRIDVRPSINVILHHMAKEGIPTLGGHMGTHIKLVKLHATPPKLPYIPDVAQLRLARPPIQNHVVQLPHVLTEARRVHQVCLSDLLVARQEEMTLASLPNIVLSCRPVRA